MVFLRSHSVINVPSFNLQGGHQMLHLRWKELGYAVLLSSAFAGATPVAISQITYDFSTATVGFGSGTLISSSASFISYASTEDNSGKIEQEIFVAGTAFALDDGISASATSEPGSLKSIAQATAADGTAAAYSKASTYLTYDVQNANAFTLSLDKNALINLTTETAPDLAYAYIDEYVELSMWDGSSFQYCDSYVNFSDMTAVDGDQYPFSDNSTINLSYSFATSFTGELKITGITQSYAEASTSAPTSVPEPSGISLFILGLATLLPLSKLRKR